ncbi:MAG: CoA transferase [Chloroflexi bacterium]|nr:CoA transferase [Chloroflexota bacterium]
MLLYFRLTMVETIEKRAEPEDGPLHPYRVLDLSDQRGLLCGRLLADLGADVILIEPPGGHPARRVGPFYHDGPHPERSLYWFALNTSKRSITLDISHPDGQAIFQRLVASAHFLIEGYRPGFLDSLGLGYHELSRLNPGLVMVSITPFGQTGPYANYRATDIVGTAMGGLLFLGGTGDRPPVHCRASQAYFQVGVQAAVGSMVAHYHREITGRGQHVDVSMQQAVTAGMGIGGMHQAWDLNRVITPRIGIPYQRNPPLDYGPRDSQVFPCRDGYMLAGRFRALVADVVALINEEGVGLELRDRVWSAPDFVFLPQEERNVLLKALREYYSRHTRQELYEKALARRIMWCPVNTPADLPEDKQLQHRGFFCSVDHLELGESIVYPGPPFQATGMSARIRRRAPLIGEDNEEVYQLELGYTPRELAAWKYQGTI